MDDFELESDFDALVEYFAELKAEEQRRGTINIVNPRRLEDLKEAVEALTRMIKESESDAKINFGISDFSGGGYITIEIPDVIVLQNFGRFQSELQKLNNCEIQIANNKLQINFMLHGVVNTQLLHE